MLQYATMLCVVCRCAVTKQKVESDLACSHMAHSLCCSSTKTSMGMACQLCSLGYSLTHTCDDVRQAGVKVLQQLTDRVDEEEGVIITVEQPTVLSLICLHIAIHIFIHSFIGLFAHSIIHLLVLYS